jgi:hypothetical protein
VSVSFALPSKRPPSRPDGRSKVAVRSLVKNARRNVFWAGVEEFTYPRRAQIIIGLDQR